MEIDGLRCAVCEYIQCVPELSGRDGSALDVYFGLNVVCSNILIGDGEGGYISASDFETCDQGQLEAIAESQGVFEMYDPDYGKCFTSVEGCDRDENELEQSGYYDCGCIDKGLPTDGVSPFLENAQLTCSRNEDETVSESELCQTLQQDTIQRTYSSYVKETNTRTIQLESGSNLKIEKFDCLTTRGSADGCLSCKAFIDDKECDSCVMSTCSSNSEAGEGMLAPSVSCGNASDEIADSKIIDLCRPNSASGTPFEAFAQCGFGEAEKIPIVVPETKKPDNVELPPSASLLACREKKREFKQRTNSFIDSQVLGCECFPVDKESGGDSGTLLECTSNGGACGTTKGGSVCNGDYEEDESGGMCFREELVQGFLADGSSTPMTRTTTYTHGKTLGNSMVGRTLVLTEFGSGSEGCQLLVDGEACASCKLEKCGGSVGVRPLVDCSNIIDHKSYKLDTCESFAPYEEGFLLRLASGASGSGDEASTPSNDFGFCIEAPNEIDLDFPVDPSLPTVCDKAQPIVLPTHEDDIVSKIRAIANPNGNFAFVSFVSTTDGLSVATDELAAVQTPCHKGEDGADLTEATPGLWYSLVGTGKGVHASVCREATNFGSRISVYEGSCGSMDCVAATPLVASMYESSCDVHWIAEEGKTYYVRVHGSEGSETGTFNLFLETLEEEVTSTCYLDETNEFDLACLSCSKARSGRIQQFPNHPDEIDCRCLENPTTGGYHLTCVDLSCLKCNARQDVCGFDTFELEIGREGSTPMGSYESFYFMNKADGTQANEIVSIQAQDCLEIKDPYHQCMIAKENVMDDPDSPFFCECRGVSEEGDYMLICSIYDSYEYCASSEIEKDVCADILFGQTISQYGYVKSEYRNYILENEDGTESEVTIERYSDTCYATINEEACSKCEILQTCVDNRREEDVLKILAVEKDMAVFTDISVDCSNILSEEGDDSATATFECGSANNESSHKILMILAGDISPTKEALTNGISKDKQTIPPDAFPPTMPPITKPTNPPILPPSVDPLIEVEDINATSPKEPTANPTAKDTTASAARGLVERQTVVWVASTMALASLFLML